MAEPELSLAAYANIRASLDAGQAQDVVLQREEVDAALYEASDRAWRARLEQGRSQWQLAETMEFLQHMRDARMRIDGLQPVVPAQPSPAVQSAASSAAVSPEPPAAVQPETPAAVSPEPPAAQPETMPEPPATVQPETLPEPPAAVQPETLPEPPAAVQPETLPMRMTTSVPVRPALDATVNGIISPFAGSALPFKRSGEGARLPEVVGDTSASVRGSKTVSLETARLNLDQFASLMAELAVNSDDRPAVLARYGFDESEFAAEAGHWEKRWANAPHERADYERQRQVFVAWLSTHRS